MYARNVVGVFVMVSSSSISVPVENVCDSCCVSSEEVWFRLNFDINGDSPRLNSSVGGNVVLVDVITVVVVVAVVDGDVVLLVVFRRFGRCGRFVEVFLLNL